LEGCAGPNIEVRVHDIVTDALEERFDVVHARLLLEHLPERRAVLDKLVDALDPGGWLLVEDVDVSGPVHLASSRQFASPARFGRVGRRVTRAAQSLAAAVGADFEFGRDLPTHLVDAGLQEIGAEMYSRLVRGGSAMSRFPALTFRRVGPTLVAKGLVSQRDMDWWIAAWDDPTSMMFSLPMVSAWGQRPS
jgi:SAM-dependent methyltransferase